MTPLRLGLRVIKPKTTEIIPAGGIQQQVDQRLADFAGEMIDVMASYPAQLPPARGRRRYRRTGGLARGWKVTTRKRNFIEVANAVDHAVYAQGPPNGAPGRRQTAVMRARHWQNITTESARVWAKHRPGIASIFVQPRGRGISFRRLR